MAGDAASASPSFSWPRSRQHASNHILVIIVTQGAVGQEKSRSAAGGGGTKVSGESGGDD
jgi:hypothetical protein